MQLCNTKSTKIPKCLRKYKERLIKSTIDNRRRFRRTSINHLQERTIGTMELLKYSEHGKYLQTKNLLEQWSSVNIKLIHKENGEIENHQQQKTKYTRMCAAMRTC